MDYQVHPSAIVEEGAVIGRGSRIWHFCHVMPGAVIGEGCSIGQNCFVADGAVLENGVKIQNNVSVYGGVTLRERVFIGPGVLFTNIKTPRAFIDRRDAYLPTTVLPGASIGGGAVILCGVTIGRYALVGAGAVVTGDLPDYAVALGNPARIYGRACRCGAALRRDTRHCPICGLFLPPVDFSWEEATPCATR